MAHQDSNSSDFSAKFSTLNVNAMEFVPSFAYSGATAAAVAAVNTVPVNDTPAAAATADGDTAGGGDGVAPASSTPQSSLPSSQQTTPTAAVAPAVPPPPAAAADPPVQPAAPVTAPATVTASITPEDRSPQNNGNFLLNRAWTDRRLSRS
ncbi:unnamed protein product [Hermetia illucens]|uniref:Uncharacterized protein n=1 Tax=Hermetia illucens TaxID=343691 RepID=A0A7R8UST7_HERIL|nr:unnamed protein product [Hermetia illucens]